MNNGQSDSTDNRTFPTLERVDVACDEFESLWKEGKRPDIADHASAFPERDRPALVVELVQLDIAYRRRAGETPAVTEYAARFPEYDAQIRRAFDDHSLVPTADDVSATQEIVATDNRPGDEATTCLTSDAEESEGDGRDARAKFQAATLPSIQGYQIKGRLGAGGMGDVWRAVQLSTGREVALKTIKGSFASAAAGLRFQREVELAARLDHPNIAQVFDSGRDGDVDYYAMRLVDGQNLDRYVKSAGLDQRTILELMQVICAAVQHAHQRGVIHRDLKPPNILVDQHGAPHVLDFGLAKEQPDQAEEARNRVTLTREGAVAGTLAFMSPEQAAGRTAEVDTRTDVYALGVILYRLLTGNSPHAMEGSSLDVMRRIVEEDVRLPRQFVPGMNRDVEAILLKALAKQPAQRYGTASELGEDIGRFLVGEPVKAHAHTAMYLLRKRAWKYRVPLGLVGAALACALAVGGFYIRSIQAERDRTLVQYERAEQKTIEANDAAAEAKRNATQADQNAAQAAKNATVADENAAEAKRNANEAQKALAHAEELLWQASRTAQAEAIRRQAEDKPFEAIMYAGRALGLRPQNERAAEVALELISDLTPALPLKILEDERSVWDMAAYPDGSRLAIGYYWNETKVWDVVTGDQLFALPGRLGPICARKKWIFTFDGKTIYQSSKEDGKLIRKFPAVTSRLAWLSLDPIEKRLTVAHAEDPLVRVFDTETGEELEPFKGHTKGVHFAEFTADGQHLVSHAYDGTIRIWNAADTSREEIASIQTGVLLVSFGALRLNPKGHSLAAVANHGVTFYHIPTGQKLNQLVGKRLDYSTYGPRGNLYAVADDLTVRIHNPQINQPVVECQGMPGAIENLAFSRDGTRIAATGRDGTCMVWDARSGELLSRVVHEANASHVAFCGDGERLATATNSDTRGARIWAVSGKLDNVVTLRNPDTVTSMRLRDDGKRLAAMMYNKTRIWDMESGQVVKEFPSISQLHFLPDDRVFCVGPISTRPEKLAVRSLVDDTELVLEGDIAAAPNSVALHPSGKSVIAGNENGDLTSWDLNTGEVLFDCEATGEGKGFTHKNLHYSPDGERIASGSISVVASLRVLDGSNGRMLGVGRVRAGEVEDYDFSPDGKKLLCGYQDGDIRIWDVERNELLTTSSGHEHVVTKVRYHPQGHRFVSYSMDGTCRLWDAASGEQIATVRRKGTLGRFGFEYSRDGSLIATYGDEIIQLHDGETGRLILSLPGHTEEIQDVLFNSDNEVISASKDKTIRIWKRPPKPGVAPQWVARDLVPAISNLAGADDGSIQPIDPAAWWKSWQAIDALPVDANDPPGHFGQWFRWQKSDPRTRAVSPFSTQTIPEWVEEIAAARPAALSAAMRDQLVRIAPAHPLTPLLMAGVQEKSNPKNHAPDMLAQTYRMSTMSRLQDGESKALYGEETLQRYAQHAAALLKTQGQEDMAKRVETLFP